MAQVQPNKLATEMGTPSTHSPEELSKPEKLRTYSENNQKIIRKYSENTRPKSATSIVARVKWGKAFTYSTRYTSYLGHCFGDERVNSRAAPVEGLGGHHR